MSRLQPLLPAIAIFVLALLVRVAYNLTVARYYFPLHDSLAYQSLAFHLLDEHCYCWAPHVVTVSHAPLWPFLIAGLSLVVGRADIFDRLLLCCADAATCVLIYLFVRDLFTKRLGVVAGLVACVYPALYIYTGWLYTETLSTFLQTAVCYCVFRVLRAQGRSWRLWALCGVLLGLLSLAHPNGVLVIALFIVWSLVLVWRRRLPRAALWGTLLSVTLACMVIGPWILRDYVVSHSFVLVASGSGTVLLGAYNTMVVTDQQHLGGWIGPGQSDPQVTTPFTSHVCPAPCEVALESAETDAAIQWIRSHPDELPVLMFYHLKNFFTPYTSEADMPLNRFPKQVSSQVVLAMSNSFPIPIFLLAGLGLMVTLRRYWDQLLFAYLVILGTLAEILVFYGNARFRSPIEPLLIVLASGALWWLLESQPGTLRWTLRQRQALHTPVVPGGA